MGFFDELGSGESGGFFDAVKAATPEEEKKKKEQEQEPQVTQPMEEQGAATPPDSSTPLPLPDAFVGLPGMPQTEEDLQVDLPAEKSFFSALGQFPNVLKQSWENAKIAGSVVGRDLLVNPQDVGKDTPAGKVYTSLDDYFKRRRQEAMGAADEEQKKILAAKPEGLDSMGNLVWDVTMMMERMVPAIAGGVVTKNPEVPLAIMAPDVFGEKFKQMKDEGYDDETAKVHAGVYTGLEVLTEKVPMGVLFNKVGSPWVRRLAEYTLAEAGQESAASLLESAWDAATINPNMTLDEAVDQAMYEGLVALIGSPFLAGPVVVTQGVQQARKRRKEEKVAAEVEKEIARRTQGPQLPPEMEKVRQEGKTFEEELKKVAGETVTPPVEPVTGRSVEWFDKVGKVVDAETSQALRKSLVLESPEFQDGKAEVPFEEYDWESQGNVAIAKDDSIQRKLQQTFEAIKKLPPKSEMAAELKKRVMYLENLSESQREIMQKAQGMVEELMDRFLPGRKVVLGTGHIKNALEKQLGRPIPAKYRGKLARLDDGTFFIELNPKQLTDENGVINEGLVANTVLHEVGHAVIEEVYNKLPEIVQKALRNMWLKKMQSLVGEEISYEDFLRRRNPYYAAQAAIKKAGKKRKKPVKLVVRNPAYLYSFNEFLANEFAKSVEGNSVLSGVMDKHFKKAAKELRRVYEETKGLYDSPKSFKTFLEWLGNQAKFEEARRKVQKKGVEDTGKTTEQLIKEHVMRVTEGVLKRPGMSKMEEQFIDDLRGDMDVYNKGLEISLTLLQLLQLNPHIAGLNKYVDLTEQWWTEKTTWEERAHNRLKEWQSLGGERLQRFSRFMLDLTILSTEKEKYFDITSPEFQELAKKYQMDREMMALYDLVTRDFRDALDAMMQAQIEFVQSEFKEDPVQMEREVAEIEKEFSALKKRNFFPLARFGDYFVRVISLQDQMIDGKMYKAGSTVSFETFESEKAQKKRGKELKGSKLLRAELGRLTPLQKQFLGLPHEFIRSLKDKLDLTTEQRQELEELLLEMHPAESFKKHMKHRKNVPGFSTDGLRAYASYFQHFGNYLARVRYRWQLQDAIGEVKESANLIRRTSGDATKRDEIAGYLQKHYEYIMNPENELANLRAFGFTWYLAFVPKSAIVNLTQVPAITYPYLASRYGDKRAVKALVKAMKDSAFLIKNPQKLSMGQLDMVTRLKKTGVLDESIATELAAVSEGSLLQRLLPGTFLHSERAAYAIRTLGQMGAWMFQQAEKVNRRVTALAAYDLAKAEGLSHEEAVKKAKRAVQETQFEYARWNRPIFMRGKKSVFFLFWMYKQHALFFMFNDPGKWRALLMIFLLAGLSGLPFAEDIMDLLDFLLKKTKEMTGEENLPTNVELETRKFVKKLGADPDLVMHGLGGNLFGLFDISGSLSMGRVVPMIEPVLGEGDFDARMNRALVEAGGALPAIGYNFVRAVADDNPNTLKRFERTLPTFVKGPVRAYRWATEGKATVGNENTIAHFDISNPLQAMEILGQAAGFAPSRINRLKDKYYMTQEMLKYYELRKRRLLQVLNFAIETKDKKLEAQTWKEIYKYNRSVPYFFLKLTGENIKRSRQQKFRKNALTEQGIFTRFKQQQLQEEVDKGFVEEEVLK